MLQSLPMVAEFISPVNPGLSSIMPILSEVGLIVIVGAAAGGLAGELGIRILDHFFVYEEDEQERMRDFAIQFGVVAMLLGVNYLLLR